MRVLSISSADGGAMAAVVQDGSCLAQRRIVEAHGLAAVLPAMVASVLAEAGATPDLVAVVVGPGSFTGLRAGVSVACGVALGHSIQAMGVTTAEAMTVASADLILGRQLWTAIEARRGRVFIDTGATVSGYATDQLPKTDGPVAVCGSAASLVAAALAARGSDVMLTALRTASPEQVAAVALRRVAGAMPPLPAVPLYVDAPEARPPATGFRPPPAGACRDGAAVA